MRPISLISTLFAVVVLVVSIPVDFDEALIPEQGGTLNPDQFYAFNAQQGDSSNIGYGSYFHRIHLRTCTKNCLDLGLTG